MFDLLTNLGLDPVLVIRGLILSTVLLIALYRRYIFSLFEPISMFLVAQIGDATTMLALPLAMTYKWHFLGYMLCLWIGFAFFARSIKPSPQIQFNQPSLFHLKFILVALGVGIIAANLYLGITAGFPLLSADPTSAKVTVFTGGLGVVRRLNMGPYSFFCSGCALLIITNNSRRFATMLLTLATILVIFSGGKSVLLPLLFALTFVVAHKGLCLSDQLKKKISKVCILLLSAGLFVAVIITSKEHGGIVGGLQNFALRLLLAGDVILYYFPRREIIMGMVDANIMGFFRNAFADILGLLRLSDYTLPLGSIILGSEDGGPNVQYFIAADLFFQPLIGFLYCFAVGASISTLRNAFFGERSSSAMRFAVRLFLALIAFDLATDCGMFLNEVFIAFGLVGGLYAISTVCRAALNTSAPVWLQASPGRSR